MKSIEFEGKQRPLIQTFLWKGARLKVMEEIQDPQLGKVLFSYLNYEKTYIITNPPNEPIVVRDQAIIDYLDDHYARPILERDIVY